MEWFWTLNAYSKAFFAWFGNTYVLGIPLNIPAHIIVSATIYYILATRGYRVLACLLITLSIGVLKEIYDLTAVLKNGDYMDPVRSMSGNLMGVIIGHYLSRPVKNAPESPTRKQI